MPGTRSVSANGSSMFTPRWKTAGSRSITAVWMKRSRSRFRRKTKRKGRALEHGPLWTASLRIGFPHAQAAKVNIPVISGHYPFGQGFEQPGVAAAQDDVIGNEGKLQFFQAK